MSGFGRARIGSFANRPDVPTRLGDRHKYSPPFMKDARNAYIIDRLKRLGWGLEHIAKVTGASSQELSDIVSGSVKASAGLASRLNTYYRLQSEAPVGKPDASAKEDTKDDIGVAPFVGVHEKPAKKDPNSAEMIENLIKMGLDYQTIAEGTGTSRMQLGHVRSGKRKASADLAARLNTFYQAEAAASPIKMTDSISMSDPLNLRNFAKALKMKGVSQAALAKEMGVAAGTVGDFVTGRSKPSFKMRRKLLEALNIDYRQLFGDEELDAPVEVEEDASLRFKYLKLPSEPKVNPYPTPLDAPLPIEKNIKMFDCVRCGEASHKDKLGDISCVTCGNVEYAAKPDLGDYPYFREMMSQDRHWRDHLDAKRSAATPLPKNWGYGPVVANFKAGNYVMPAKGFKVTEDPHEFWRTNAGPAITISEEEAAKLSREEILKKVDDATRRAEMRPPAVSPRDWPPTVLSSLLSTSDMGRLVRYGETASTKAELNPSAVEPMAIDSTTPVRKEKLTLLPPIPFEKLDEYHTEQEKLLEQDKLDEVKRLEAEREIAEQRKLAAQRKQQRRKSAKRKESLQMSTESRSELDSFFQ